MASVTGREHSKPIPIGTRPLLYVSLYVFFTYVRMVNTGLSQPQVYTSTSKDGHSSIHHSTSHEASQKADVNSLDALELDCPSFVN